MGVGVTCPHCRVAFAFFCDKCLSYNVEIKKGFQPEKYFQTQAAFYLKCKECQSEYGYVLCPGCSKKIFPTPPFVKGDAGEEKARGCFIATVCLEENSAMLQHLYLLRDEFLENSPAGRKLVQYYYQYSPAIASRIRNNRPLKAFLKIFLIYPAYYLLLGAEKIHSFHKK
jgi:hypothetical protein